MSDVKTIRDALLSKIATAVGVGTTVQKWAGDEKAMGASKPAVFVQWAGGITGESLEIGCATSVTDLIFHVIVQTQDVAGTDGDDQAATLLESIRTALNEVEMDSIGIARPYRDTALGGKTEMLMACHGGEYGYVQAWKVEQLIE